MTRTPSSRCTGRRCGSAAGTPPSAPGRTASDSMRWLAGPGRRAVLRPRPGLPVPGQPRHGAAAPAGVPRGPARERPAGPRRRRPAPTAPCPPTRRSGSASDRPDVAADFRSAATSGSGTQAFARSRSVCSAAAFSARRPTWDNVRIMRAGPGARRRSAAVRACPCQVRECRALARHDIHGNFTIRSRRDQVAKVRVPRKGVTQAELASVLSRRLGAEFQVAADGHGSVIARRSPLSAAVVRITSSPRRHGLPGPRPSACRSSASARPGSSPTPCAVPRSSAPLSRVRCRMDVTTGPPITGSVPHPSDWGRVAGLAVVRGAVGRAVGVLAVQVVGLVRLMVAIGLERLWRPVGMVGRADQGPLPGPRHRAGGRPAGSGG